jgi:hypothetical protein
LLAATSTGGCQVIQHVDDHDDDVRLVDGKLGLLADLVDKAYRSCGKRRGLVGRPALFLALDDLQPAGIHDGKGHAVPVGIAV